MLFGAMFQGARFVP